jgi:peptide deformylase
VNPQIEFDGDAKLRLWEGCLSIPGLRGPTERRASLHLEAMDREGRIERTAFQGFPAAIIQHETDHLDGIFFLQRMPDLSLLSFEDQMPPDDEEDGDGDEEDTPGGPPSAGQRR